MPRWNSDPVCSVSTIPWPIKLLTLLKEEIELVWHDLVWVKPYWSWLVCVPSFRCSLIISFIISSQISSEINEFHLANVCPVFCLWFHSRIPCLVLPLILNKILWKSISSSQSGRGPSPGSRISYNPWFLEMITVFPEFIISRFLNNIEIFQ